MKRVEVALVVFFLVVSVATSATALGPEWVGKPAPGFTLSTVDGRTALSLKDLRGQVVILDFWASWCAPCKRSLPRLAELERGTQGVKVVAVSIDDDRRNALEFLRRHSVQVVALFDESKKVAARYNVPAMPTAIVLDKDGIVRYVHVGYTDEDLDGLASEVKSLL